MTVIHTPLRNVADFGWHRQKNKRMPLRRRMKLASAAALPRQQRQPADLGAAVAAAAVAVVVAAVVAVAAAVAAAEAAAAVVAVDAASAAQRIVGPHALGRSILSDPRKMLVGRQQVPGTHWLLRHTTGGGERRQHGLSRQRAGAKALLELERHVGNRKRRHRHLPTY